METPETFLARREKHKAQGGMGFPLAVQTQLWATPDAGVFNDGDTPETFLARREEHKAQGGSGFCPSLAVQTQLWATPTADMWPTPQAFDSNACDRSEEARARALAKGGCRNLREWSQMWASQSEESGTDSLSGHPAPRMMPAGGWFSPATPGLPLRFRLNPRFVCWLMGIPWEAVTPCE